MRRLALAVGLWLHAGAAWAALDAPRLEAILGAKLAAQDGELKFSVPQTELKVVVDGFSITPAMGLTSWAAFSPHGKDAMVMGDLVLLEDEFRPVQRAVLDAGLSITAIHNHMVGESPRVVFLHFWGVDTLTHLAKGLKAALDKTGPGKKP